MYTQAVPLHVMRLFVAMNTGGVGRSRSLDVGYRRLKAAVGGDIGSGDAMVRTRSNSESELELIINK